MANFDTSNLVVAQTMLADQYASPEMRQKPAPVFDLLSGNAPLLIVGAETLKTRDDRSIEAHLLSRTVRTAGTARAHDHTGTIDDSQKITLSWTTKSDKFAISLKLLNKSVFDFNRVLANKFQQACMNILEAKETEAIAYLMAQRSTASPTLKGATFNATTDAVEIAAANATTFYQRLKSVMKQNYFGSTLDVVSDPLMSIAAQYNASQGSGNSANLAFQFQGMNIVDSIELTDADYAGGVVLAMPSGSVSALNWIPKENRNGWGDYNSDVGGYGTINFAGYQFAVHGYAARANTSSANGDLQDVSMEFEVSLDSSYNKAPLTTIAGRTDSVIIEAAQLV
jgi:vacuolar-type H+-ATPase subunit E/Vma4